MGGKRCEIAPVFQQGKSGGSLNKRVLRRFPRQAFRSRRLRPPYTTRLEKSPPSWPFAELRPGLAYYTKGHVNTKCPVRFGSAQALRCDGGYNQIMRTSNVAEKLSPYLIQFVGGADGGCHAFHLHCSKNGCYSMGHISASRRTLGSQKHRLRTAEKFAQQGWTCVAAPLCPTCSNRVA